MNSTSCMKPKVAPRDVAHIGVSAKSMVTEVPVLSMAGWLNTIEKPAEAVVGLEPDPLVALDTPTAFFTRRNFAAFCSSMPADWSRNTKGRKLPSRIGISGHRRRHAGCRCPAGERRHQVLDRSDLCPPLLQPGAHARVAHRIGDRRAGSTADRGRRGGRRCRCRAPPGRRVEGDLATAVQADAGRRDDGSGCAAGS